MILVTVAGLPRDYADVIKDRALAIKGQESHLICPENLENGDYSEGYIKKILSEMCNNVKGLSNQKHISSVVFYVPFETPGTEELRRSLFPHSLAMPIEQLNLRASTPKMARQRANELAGYLKKKVLDARRRLGIIRHEVVNNSNKTPILLPIKSFKARSLVTELEILSAQLAENSDTQSIIDAARAKITALYPQKSKKSGGKKYFFDERNLFFEAPCIAGPNHGNKTPIENGGHIPLCTLNGISRLGGGFLRGFHYDCSVEKGNVRFSFKNCHDKDISTDKEWVNIYPNDHVR
ncbi:hypothetical protein GGE65_006204 [Skermanella aerolata]|uniref:hypothetical protein n=1 Tax=Skermanella aerolata TaxID=393310 RepID=UPI003D1E49D0